MLDGLEHDPPTILASNFFETAKFYSLTEHIYSPLTTYFSDATFRRMAPKLRDGFLDAAAKAPVATRAYGLAVESEAMALARGSICCTIVTGSSTWGEHQIRSLRG